jgi:pimeloyl-ACP methyl ester carboxylesterase
MADDIQPFTLSISQGQLDDLQQRLARTRFPERETVDDWTQGAPLAKVQALVEHWRTAYDWRRFEAQLNALGQFTTAIDGIDVHFLHVRSPHENALPLLITHGWPGSVAEFMKVYGPLTNPTAHGGKAEDAFHVVAPSMPGYGFSSKPSATGWKVPRIAAAWIELMRRLDYTRWVAQGGDWGAAVTTAIGVARPPGCAAVHVNMPLVTPTPEDIANATPEEQKSLAHLAYFQDKETGYSKEQGTRPQTLGYGLADSPAGQAAWIYEKMWAWTDNQGAPEDVLTHDEMLDNIMLYWLPNCGASSGRLYWESYASFASTKLELPTGVSVYPREIIRPSRRWAEKQIPNLIHFNELEKGGHFAAWEQPASFVDELRTCFAKVR